MPKEIYDAFDIAKYFLFKAQSDEELISNLKLQKLLYYAQGLHLAFFNSPLFNKEIKAWTYGPVVPELYHMYKKHSSAGIPADESFDPNNIDEETQEYLDEIYEVFGQFSALRLKDLTHEDECWSDAHPGGIISLEAMRKTMKKYLKDGEE